MLAHLSTETCAKTCGGRESVNSAEKETILPDKDLLLKTAETHKKKKFNLNSWWYSQ